MRRIHRTQYKLSQQLLFAAQGIQGEPNWPSGAPSDAEVEAAGNQISDLGLQLVEAENVMEGLRASMKQALTNGTDLMRRVDNVTSALYGDASSEKLKFGLRPVDYTRNSPGATPQVVGLALMDGPSPGVIAAKWKRVPRATYEVHWFLDETMTNLAGATVAAANKTFVPLAPGTQIWLRVRALRGKRLGDWSEPATRIANV